MSEPQGVLCVFSKAPVPGEVKTRLVPELGREGAAKLYSGLLGQTLATACASQIEQVRLYCSPDTGHPEFARLASQFGVELRTQYGDGLGAKMHRALEESLAVFDFALVLGCDCPWLRVADLNTAYYQLSRGMQAVLGPAKDGGYYLLGLRSPSAYLFNDQSWGSDRVLEETRRRLALAAIDWFELPEYPDIDLPGDLDAYRKLRDA